MIRTFGHDNVEKMAEIASIPVINGLTDYSHPCQALADYMTMIEVKGDLERIKIVYVGDGNNVAHSLMFAAARLGTHLAVATPKGYEPAEQAIQWTRATATATGCRFELTNDRRLRPRMPTLYTPTSGPAWARRRRLRRGSGSSGLSRSNEELFSLAKPDAVFMHCLPAHRGEEVSAGVIDSPRSVVFQQAENRLHAQKAVMMSLMG